MFIHPFRAAVLLTVMTLLAACSPSSGSGGGGSTYDGPVDVLPLVQVTVPLNQETGVPIAQAISARFSEPMDPATITASTFTLTSTSGSVAGSATLSADGLVADFTPGEPLDFARVYTATLTIDIRGASGQSLAGGAYSWTFTTRIPSWTQSGLGTGPIDVFDGHVFPDIAIDDSDNAVAVWRQGYNLQARMFARRAIGGNAWESPVELDTGPEELLSPVVGIDGSGQILAAWSTGSTIWYTRAGMTGAWDAPLPVATSAGAPANLRHLLVDAEGNALLFYFDEGINDDVNVFVVRFDTVTGWEAPEALPITFYPTLPSPKMDRAGFAVMTWLSGSPAALLSRRFIPGSGWSATETIAPADATRPVHEGTLAMDGAGNCLASWTKQRNPGGQPYPVFDREIYVSRCSTTSSWSAAELGPNTVGQEGLYVQAALAPDGSATLTWFNILDSRCWASRQTTPGEWTAREVVDTSLSSGISSMSQPFIAAGGRVGVFGVNNIPGSYGRVWVNEFVPASGWGASTTHHTAGGGIVYFKMTSDSAGRAAAIWLEQSMSYQVRCSRYR